MSHTKLDERFCDLFDRACARVGIKSFRSEFETISPPAWKTIRDEMNKSSAMFLLIGKELVKMQKKSSHDPKTAQSWKYTQNWIAYEIGLSCERGIDVWVLCDAVPINFPVPYFNHYQPFADSVNWLKQVLNMYKKLGWAPSPQKLKYACLNDQCRIEFTFWAYRHPRPFGIPCPQCLQIMKFG